MSAISVVVPVKELGRAKARVALPADLRQDLALAMFTDTVTASLSAQHVGLVIVVTADPLVASTARSLGAVVEPEPRPAGLNRAIQLGRQRATAQRPDSPVATLMADLPYLRPADLDQAIEEFHDRRRELMVADRHGTGTTCLVQGATSLLPTRFGDRSAAAHLAQGYFSARGSLTSLRHDVDTVGDLRDTPAGDPASAVSALRDRLLETVR